MIKKDTFDKEKFKKELESNVRMLFRRKLEEATPQQIYQAVAYSVKDDIIDNWIETHKAYEKQDKKMVYYMSMEFLMGRALGNNMINLLCYDDVRETLEELGLDLNLIEDQEPDAALGNGGLGRLAACFLDSLATLGYPAYGCGIRYRYGMFKQKIENGYQVEVRDDGLGEAIEQLEKSQQDLLLLYFFLGFTIKEIAEMYQCSVRTIIRRKDRALASMRQALEAE